MSIARFIALGLVLGNCLASWCHTDAQHLCDTQCYNTQDYWGPWFACVRTCYA